jgi:hypothetical protein
VREVGVDSEMVFIRLVSAIEALCRHVTLDRKDDALEEQKIATLIASSDLSPGQKKNLRLLSMSENQERNSSALSSNIRADTSRVGTLKLDA